MRQGEMQMATPVLLVATPSMFLKGLQGLVNQSELLPFPARVW